MAEEKRDHDAKMKKMEAEMEQVFEMKVKEKKQKLKDSEADVRFYTIKCVCGVREDGGREGFGEVGGVEAGACGSGSGVKNAWGSAVAQW